MLVLTRRVGETLRIGSDISVTVVGMKGGQIRIGVRAPKTVPVHREELYERIQRERTPQQDSRGFASFPARAGTVAFARLPGSTPRQRRLGSAR